MGRIIGYARASNHSQSSDVQVSKLNQYGCEKIYRETSGVDDNRPKLSACLDYLRKGDKLVITRLDRMAKSAYHLGTIVENLKKKKVDFIVLDQNMNTGSPQGTLIFQMLASFAEFERNLRRERQLVGIHKAKAQGRPFGRPLKVDRHLINNVKTAIDKGITVSKILEFYKISQTTYYRIKSGHY